MFWYYDFDSVDRQVFVHYEMSISKICKLARGYTYQVASRELSFAAACSEKE